MVKPTSSGNGLKRVKEKAALVQFETGPVPKKAETKITRKAAVASTTRKFLRLLGLLVRASTVIQGLMLDANKPATRRRAEKWLKEFDAGLTDEPLKWF